MAVAQVAKMDFPLWIVRFARKRDEMPVEAETAEQRLERGNQ